MKAMYKSKNNAKQLKSLIELVDSRMNTVSMKVQNKQLDLSVEMDKKIDQITLLMEKMAEGARGKSDPADMDPQVLAEIAKQAGMEANEAMRNELGQMSERMEKKADEIAKLEPNKRSKAPAAVWCHAVMVTK